MTRITEKFRQIKDEGRKALIPFVTLGDPNLDETRRIIFELEKAGADLIELGVPFSDPLADGPIIQRAQERALGEGFTLDKGLALIAELRQKVKVPLVLFSYYNPLFAFGFKDLVQEIKRCGVDGLLITDLSIEEAEEPVKLLRLAEIDSIFLAAPTSTEERIKMIANYSSGFIYAVSRMGVTGTRKSISLEVESLVKRIRGHSKLPIAVGFGISAPGHVKQIWNQSEGAVVGSAIVQCIEENLGKSDLAKQVGNFTRWLKGAS